MRYILIFFITIGIGCSTNKSKRLEKEKEPENIEAKELDKYEMNFTKAEMLSEVLAKAEKEDKWIYVDVGAKWCLPCKIMKRDVYSNKETVKIINDNFISYMVDIEKGEGPDLKLIFDINSYPTLLFIDSKGRVKLKKESAITGTGLISFAKEALNLKTENK